MGFVVIGLLVINVAGNFYLARAIRGLRDLVIERSLAGAELSAGLSKLVLDQAVDAVMQSKITRSYLVEILERRILPTIGWTEKPKTEIEKFMLQVWQDEVTDVDCGTLDDASQQTNQ